MKIIIIIKLILFFMKSNFDNQFDFLIYIFKNKKN